MRLFKFVYVMGGYLDIEFLDILFYDKLKI